MAIFRAGKRIGPFDIRGGISRGDFKSSAYHKTDRDPRFKMQANLTTLLVVSERRWRQQKVMLDHQDLHKIISTC